MSNSNESVEIVRGCTLRVVRGRKVAIGTEGVCMWVGGTRYGRSVGIRVAGSPDPVWTDANNVEVIVQSEPAVPARSMIVAVPAPVAPAAPVSREAIVVQVEAMPKKADKRPYPWVRKASEQDLAWDPEAVELFSVVNGTNVRAGEMYAVVRPGQERWPIGEGSDHYVVTSHRKTDEAITSFCSDLVSPNGKMIVGHGYRVIQGYWVRHTAARAVTESGLSVESKLVVVNDHTCAGALRSSLVTYVGGEAIGSIVRGRALHVSNQPEQWHADVQAMVETAMLVQDALLDLLNAAAVRELTDEDRKFFETKGIKVRSESKTALDAIRAWNKGFTRKISWGTYQRRLGDDGILALCELLGKTRYGRPIDAIVGGFRYGGRPEEV